ncbi:MAG: ligase-associated DNA damage response DEXH box helicase, partial [Rhodothermales bacterium]|nr:ligase-associated DNA damage response DEXH box helicase [Rhodothermales bacterium]
PESVSLLLTYPRTKAMLAGLRCVVVDEWHELIGSKRGTMTELALARLRRWHPDLRTWGVSATLGNLPEAKETLLGAGKHPEAAVVEGEHPKEVVIDSVLPEAAERFPWAGHLGLALVDGVVEAVEEATSTLVFTNTRRQAEQWYQALLERRPDWAGTLALHHGSLARGVRRFVEKGLKEGAIRCVVATSSLDLGVDFPPVDRVLQVGSPKGVARLLQRAGRSGHQPGVASRVTVVPTHAFELVEAAAAREAAHARHIEARRPIEKPLDLLAQHLITAALGEPFEEAAMRDEVRSTRAYRKLTDAEWAWALDFAATGGPALHAYDEFHRLALHRGRWHVRTEDAAKRHRMVVGVIVGDTEVEVKYQRGQKLGTVQESFISRLSPGDAFFFAGKTLELVRLRDGVAHVRRAKNPDAGVPQFSGARLPLSTELGAAVRDQLDRARRSDFGSPELEAVRPILDVQERWSRIPAADELLIERVRTREGTHLFVYPFEGRLVHEGIAALVAYRMSRMTKTTFALSFTDYGFELLSKDAPPLERALAEDVFTPDRLVEDVEAALNETEMAKRQFREIARVAGLLFPGYPGRSKSVRQLQVSAGLLFDVFRQHDPGNLLLRQARREVLERQLEADRLRAALERIGRSRVTVTEPPKPTPLAFPILTARLGEKVSSETVGDRIRKMALRLERAAG